ncbi:hypothetical protein PPERSA_07521 [Pseudocohnilembus persalinus]|uniref:Uncharacterized protein n=1 Tax=Pseudocohnilembus persalinus TaxID=266149 RepID=A0A0V0QZZ2_PSEPJ|nr:hypothetical protein PPERSA_07521 [Pseudocohnilembus persalinus]|eukprot:KRX07771.1 hypothetical protein PPERSA_07521 [Pseudocohnilembus persalinus]
MIFQSKNVFAEVDTMNVINMIQLLKSEEIQTQQNDINKEQQNMCDQNVNTPKNNKIISSKTNNIAKLTITGLMEYRNAKYVTMDDIDKDDDIQSIEPMSFTNSY